MSAAIHIPHPNLEAQETYLTSDVAASATSSTVKNNDGFANGDYILLGRLGNENSEIVALTSVTGNTTLGHTTGPVYAHSQDTPVFNIQYNRVEISSSTTETGTYSVLATVNLDVDEQYTSYVDTSGDEDTWYKYRYNDQAGSAYSGYYDVFQGSGWTSNSLRSMATAVFEDLHDRREENFERSQINRYLRDGVKRVSEAVARLNKDHLTAYDTQTITSGTETYDLPDRFIKFKKIDIAYSGSSDRRAYPDNEAAGLPDTSYSTDYPRYYRRGSSFGVRPSDTSGTAKLWFYQYPDEMSDDNDTHGLPYGAENVLIAYAVMRGWKSSGNDKRWAMYRREFEDALEEYLLTLSEDFQGYSLPVLKTYDSETVEDVA